MRLKSFHGPTLQDAMRQVRDALGDDAIIVATRDEEEGGVRVTAAIDEESRQASKQQAAAAHEALTPFSEDDIDEDIVDQVADSLQRHGTPAALAEKIITAVMRQDAPGAAEALAQAFSGMMRFAPLCDENKRHILLLGPPGAGKTAMVGKLAARAALAGKKVAIITTDLARAGGVAQLQAYTSSLKIPLLQVEDPHALQDALAVHATADIVFVDSMGRNPLDEDDAAELKLLIKGLGTNDGCAVLVMPAGLDAIDGAETAAAFKNLGATHLLSTRLDLTRRLGSLLSIGNDTRLYFCEASNSPSIASGLDRLDAFALACKVLGLEPEKKNAAATTTEKPHAAPTNHADAKSSAANAWNYGKR